MVTLLVRNVWCQTLKNLRILYDLFNLCTNNNVTIVMSLIDSNSNGMIFMEVSLRLNI